MVERETRYEAFKSVDRQKRYQQILSILKVKPMTAKEIAVAMYLAGEIPTDERNFTSPRLTEMRDKGWVETCGKRMCEFSGKMVTVYRVKESA